MRNIYHSDIVNLLIRQGRGGMRLKHVAQCIYNMHADLFGRKLDYFDLHMQISRYLWRQSRKPGTPFLHVAYGRYALKPDYAVQLDLFWDAPEYHIIEEKRKKRDDLQLTFDF